MSTQIENFNVPVKTDNRQSTLDFHSVCGSLSPQDFRNALTSKEKVSPGVLGDLFLVNQKTDDKQDAETVLKSLSALAKSGKDIVTKEADGSYKSGAITISPDGTTATNAATKATFTVKPGKEPGSVMLSEVGSPNDEKVTITLNADGSRSYEDDDGKKTTYPHKKFYRLDNKEDGLEKTTQVYKGVPNEPVKLDNGSTITFGKDNSITIENKDGTKYKATVEYNPNSLLKEIKDIKLTITKADGTTETVPIDKAKTKTGLTRSQSVGTFPDGTTIGFTHDSLETLTVPGVSVGQVFAMRGENYTYAGYQKPKK